MITIVNYGMGNLGSLMSMFQRIGEKVICESDPDKIRKAEKLVLPGVGAFNAAMTKIDEVEGLREVLDEKAVKEKIPILGICLGMQLLTRGSEEGQRKGLNWIPGSTLKFPDDVGLKVPHMGWNIANIQYNHRLVYKIEQDTRYYFVHSYYVSVDSPEFSLMKTSYGVNFDSAIVRDNILGVQFHPEKSHRFGKTILSNFAKI